MTPQLAERYGKQVVVCDKDTPGFITSRLIIALGLEAMRIVEEGDRLGGGRQPASRLGFGHAMGPLDTLDFPGWTPRCTSPRTCASSTATASWRRRTCACWSRGHLGRKTGRGFTNYDTAT